MVDLGCGFGWFARWARDHGASRVLGLDLSEKMIARARDNTADDAIAYEIADLDRLQLPEAAFEFAYSSLAFHYIEDFGRLTATVYRALTPGGQFVFTIEHPIFMAPSEPGWTQMADGRRAWPVDRYAAEGARRTDWFAKGVLKYHRTMGTTLNALIAAGFAIRHVQEWAPSEEQVATNPALAAERERPMFLLVSARR